MKIIISHDVDHLFFSDHVFKDLILEKLWIRSFVHMCTGKVSAETFWYRVTCLFHNRMHRIYEIMEYDKNHGIPSTFFFGMDNILGMSYSKKTVAPIIKEVMLEGFDVGVHGVDYKIYSKMQKEYLDFSRISGLSNFGVRTHYVRFDDTTFNKMDKIGYFYDTTWFNKEKLDFRNPYKVGRMWEFPLHIMDMYMCKPGRLERGLQKTFSAIMQAEREKMEYCTILFHDYQFDERFDPQMKLWYEMVIKFCEKHGLEFVSYREAIDELERRLPEKQIGCL